MKNDVQTADGPVFSACSVSLQLAMLNFQNTPNTRQEIAKHLEELVKNSPENAKSSSNMVPRQKLDKD